MIGETVTHYRILDKIGEGGMGVVYRAEDTRLGRQVALKFLSAPLAKDPFALERFQREARAASSLNHPNICVLFDIGTYHEQPFLVMELLHGQTLRHRLHNGPLQIDTLLEFAVQVVDALEAAHALSIVHRDIKSANLFLTERGQIKILDFGLAKLMQSPGGGDPYAETRATSSTATGQTLGTLSYMSPEQARGEELDGRSDLFSFGAVLYEMATGREPFGGRTSALVFDAILHHMPEPPSSLRPQIPAEYDHIVAKALEKDRTLRYQTAAELRADLKRVKRERESGRSSPTVSAGRAAASPARRVPTLAWIGAAVLVVALGAAGVYRWMTSGTGVDSVAVLPFTATTAATETEYLTDGITETLINRLSQVATLRVSARSVVFKYKKGEQDPQQIGRDLNVSAIVTGRVTVRGDRLVIQADLMNVGTGAQLWGDQYNRPAADLLEVQDEIATQILNKLQPRLSGDDKKRATKRYTEDPQAYQGYLQGRYHWNKGTIAGYKKAIEYFNQAIAKDPQYALAYAGLADSQLSLGSYMVELVTEAKGSVEQALRIDNGLSEAHVALGHIKLWLDWDWTAAEREFTQGISLNPTSALAHSEYAMYLATLNRLPEAITEAKKAQELEPLSPIVNSNLGWFYLYADQTTDAIAQFQKTLEFDANSMSAHQGLGVANSVANKHADAIAELTRALKLSEESPVVLGYVGAAYARQGNTAEARRVLSDLQSISTRQYVPSSAFAMVHAAMGDKSQALDWLERAYSEHDFSMAQIGIAPWFRNLRPEPRFQQLLQKLGLPAK